MIQENHRRSRCRCLHKEDEEVGYTAAYENQSPVGSAKGVPVKFKNSNVPLLIPISLLKKKKKKKKFPTMVLDVQRRDAFELY